MEKIFLFTCTTCGQENWAEREELPTMGASSQLFIQCQHCGADIEEKKEDEKEEE